MSWTRPKFIHNENRNYNLKSAENKGKLVGVLNMHKMEFHRIIKCRKYDEKENLYSRPVI